MVQRFTPPKTFSDAPLDSLLQVGEQARWEGVGQRSDPAGVHAGVQPRLLPLTVQPGGPPSSVFRLGDPHNRCVLLAVMQGVGGSKNLHPPSPRSSLALAERRH